ncbi:MAG: hypothetical protein ACLFWD_10240 [Anaerolineales bacterium]
MQFSTAIPSAAPPNPEEQSPSIGSEDPLADDLAVVWVQPDEVLQLKDSAGIAGTTITTLTYDQQSILPTGVRTSLGSSTWLEVRTSTDEIGWLPSWNLTEQVPAAAFCHDPRIGEMLDEFATSLAEEDSGTLRSLLSPKRGLIIRHDPSNPEVRIPEGKLQGIFSDPHVYRWGTRFASQTIIQGSFNEVVVPALLEVLVADPIVACNEVEVGRNADAESLPPMYQNLNFINLYRPASEGGNSFNWRTWVILFEYVEGQPYIALLLQIRPQV